MITLIRGKLSNSLRYVIIQGLLLFTLTFCIDCFEDNFIKDFNDAHQSIIQAEDSLSTGGNIVLNPREQQVDDLFMRYKFEELARGFNQADQNAASLHFFKAKPLIESSKIFQFLRRMPKGGVLHLHNTASVSSQWVVANISYMPGLLRCTTAEGVSVLSFRKQRAHKCTTSYVKVSDERQRSRSPESYDRNFEKLINLYTPTPEVKYDTIDKVWTKFQDMFTTVHDMLKYLPVFRAYHWQMLEEMYDDNIIYGEIRTSLDVELYDYSGRTFPPERTIQELLDLVQEFRSKHANFVGIKVICAPHRAADVSTVKEKFQYFLKMHFAYPDLVVGFDLVGQEDKGKPLLTLLNAIRALPKTAKYFFHAGETNWYGATTDYNLIDAILLNTTRIGHGYALLRHPLLWNAVKQRDIAVEVNPISNQVLHLVMDLRNHPGGFFISNNVPLVISNDDPGFWNAKGLSYDFYYAIMAFGSSHTGLKTLKRLVYNSIKYSSLRQAERKTAYILLNKMWDQFIDDVLQGSVI